MSMTRSARRWASNSAEAVRPLCAERDRSPGSIRSVWLPCGPKENNRPAASDLGAGERRRNDDVLPERGTPHLGHVEHVPGILDRDSPRIGLDGVPELSLVAEPAL